MSGPTEALMDVMMALTDLDDKSSVSVEMRCKPGEFDPESPSLIVAKFLAANWDAILQAAWEDHNRATPAAEATPLITPTSVILGADGKGFLQ